MHNAAAVTVSLLMKVGMVSIMDMSIQREAVMSVMTSVMTSLMMTKHLFNVKKMKYFPLHPMVMTNSNILPVISLILIYFLFFLAVQLVWSLNKYSPVVFLVFLHHFREA